MKEKEIKTEYFIILREKGYGIQDAEDKVEEDYAFMPEEVKEVVKETRQQESLKKQGGSYDN